ncbi:MAG: hypothetical protein ACYC4L_03945 [Chloroflexota bacterium]
MRTVDKAEAIAWLSSRALTNSDGRSLPSAFARQATFSIPHDSGAKTSIARELAYRFAQSDEVSESILWIDEYMIWPSAENWHLFDSYRRSLGEGRPLWERPGHLLAPSDADTMFALLSMVLYFVWGAVLASSSGEMLVRISHDEWMDVFGKQVAPSDDDLFAALNWLNRN